MFAWHAPTKPGDHVTDLPHHWVSFQRKIRKKAMGSDSNIASRTPADKNAAADLHALGNISWGGRRGGKCCCYAKSILRHKILDKILRSFFDSHCSSCDAAGFMQRLWHFSNTLRRILKFDIIHPDLLLYTFHFVHKGLSFIDRSPHTGIEWYRWPVRMGCGSHTRLFLCLIKGNHSISQELC